MNTLDSLKNTQGPDQPVKGERREERQQQQPPGEQAYKPPHPKVAKLVQALDPATPEPEAQAMLHILFNLPLIPPVTKMQFLRGNLPVADTVNRLRSFQDPQTKARLAPLLQTLNSYLPQNAQTSQKQAKSEPSVQAPASQAESSETPLPGSESTSAQKEPSEGEPLPS